MSDKPVTPRCDRLETIRLSLAAPYGAAYNDLLRMSREMEQELAKYKADHARMEWVENNLFSCPLDESDRKYFHKGSWAWRIFAPEGIQGSARVIIDAAMAREAQ